MSDKKRKGWQCDLGKEGFDHDWEFVSDWAGAPDVINGTYDCSYWQCRACGEQETVEQHEARIAKQLLPP